MSVERLHRLFPLAAIALAVACIGCDNSTNSNGATSDRWQYPVHLGDSRARVHEMLGTAGRTTSVLEEYPASGVTAWFNTEGKVVKFNFAGTASLLYSTPSIDPIVSGRHVVFDLSGNADEVSFRRVLGPPTRQSEERSTAVRELRCLWKRDGYLVDALFLASERTFDGRTFPKGSLLWFEVSRAQ